MPSPVDCLNGSGERQGSGPPYGRPSPWASSGSPRTRLPVEYACVDAHGVAHEGALEARPPPPDWRRGPAGRQHGRKSFEKSRFDRGRR